jgi:hypothetical protein
MIIQTQNVYLWLESHVLATPMVQPNTNEAAHEKRTYGTDQRF